MIGPNLATGARLAAKNESQALDEKTAKTYELRFITLEEFAKKNGCFSALTKGHSKQRHCKRSCVSALYFSKVFETVLVFCVLSVGCGFLVIEPSYYHLTENFESSGWKVNGKVTFRKFQPKIEEYVWR